MKNINNKAFSAPLRISLGCPSFSGGGAERVMVTLANEFVNRGYSVDFLVAIDEGPYKDSLSTSINKIVLTNKLDGRLLKRARAFFRLLKFFKKNEVFFMSTLREFNILCIVCWMIARSKSKLFVREADTLEQLSFCSSVKEILELNLMRLLYPKASGAIANCEVTKRDLVEFLDLEDRFVSRIYNPLNINFDKIAPVSLVNSRYIVACGRLERKKNFGDLIDVMPILLKKIPKLKLVILGEGSLQSELIDRINYLQLEGVVLLKGFVDNPYDYFTFAEVFVQTSLWEGFGYVLAEALACGTPVVAYDGKGAMREILEDGKYGKLTPVGDLEALAEAILAQIYAPIEPCLVEESVSRFDSKIIASQYLEALGAV